MANACAGHDRDAGSIHDRWNTSTMLATESAANLFYIGLAMVVLRPSARPELAVARQSSVVEQFMAAKLKVTWMSGPDPDYFEGLTASNYHAVASIAAQHLHFNVY